VSLVFSKLEGLDRRFEELEKFLSSGSLSPDEFTKLSKERAAIAEVVETYRDFKSHELQLKEAKHILSSESDTDLKSMAKEEIQLLEPAMAELEKKITVLTLPRDPNDDKNVIIEIRAGTGGEEASLFASDLMRMYQKFADKERWRMEILSASPSSSGGFKEIIAMITGQKVYSRLKFESGAHRVQRVPATESQGRIHTSACTVAILPEADDVEVHIDPKDLEIKVCRSAGAGGQHVNTTDSAVRIEHLPTGLVVECQDERSQHKNKERALKILKARLLEQAQQEQAAAISASRKTQVGSGDRSERIRTYNFPQGRMTDHRINLTLYRLEEIMEGDLAEVLDSLSTFHIEHLMAQEQHA
jgi:peptide chain release factor 1